MDLRSSLFGLLCALSVAGVSSLPAQTFPELQPEMQWRLIGPFRGGRTRAAAGVPSQPNVFYIGQVDGGVWKSDDYGRTWNPIFDGQPTQSIGAIAVAPSDPNTIYVASGEGLHRPDLSVGDGIYKSTDGGKTWNHLGLRDGQQIPALVVDPHDPNRLFAAVLGHPYGPNKERGIFRSTDGGVSWKKVLYKDENVGGSNVLLDPQHPDIIYAALWESRLGPWEDGNQYNGTQGGLFKSMDGGETWHQLTKGLPKDLVQINPVLASSDSNRLYATLATTQESGYATGAGVGVYRSDDAGESWYKVTDDPRPAMKIGGGDLPVPFVDPSDANTVYSASIVTCKSTDGGKTWASLRGAPGGDDYQNGWINPHNPNIILLVSDQGAIVSVNGGASWGSWYNQPTAQLYHVSVTNTFPYKVCGGQQESGSVCISSRGNDGEITFRDWHPVGVIEYGYVAPDPLHPEIVYGAGRNEVSRFDFVTGQVQNVTPIVSRGSKYRADRTEPILFSPVDPHLLYYAANMLFETRDGGESWTTISPDLSREHAGQPASLKALSSEDQAKRRGAIYSVAASYQNTNTIWAGTDDGLLWITRDAGKNWKNITPAGLVPWSKVTQISASHFDDNTAYVSVSRLRIDELNPFIYRTHDGGATWQPIVNGLPQDAPVNTVREDPVRKGLLFAGTETGVWFSVDDGDHWQPLQFNLPHTSMRDLWIQENDLIVATHGRSFWILDEISPLRQMSASLAESEPFLFSPGAAYRVRRDTNTDTPLPADEPAAQNPPDGAVLDYYLPDSVSGPVSLEILDGQGKVVRRYASTDKAESSEEELKEQLIPLYWLQMPKVLPATPGMHRWVWDLHYETPVATNYEYPIAAVPHATPRVPQGPLALPGSYTVRLAAGGKTLTDPLVVRIDPRVTISNSDLAAIFSLESKLSSSVSASAKASLEAHSVREQIEKLLPKAPASLSSELKSFEQKVSGVLSGKEPSLDDVSEEVRGLYLQVGQADRLPTDAQQHAAKHTLEEVSEAIEQWARIKSSTLPSINRRLREAGLPEFDLEKKPESMPESGDED